MIGSTLGGRLFAYLAVVTGVLFAGGALWGESRIRAFHREEVLRRLSTAAALLDGQARAGLAGEVPEEQLLERVRALGRGAGVRVTVIARDGRVLADSEARLPLDNHGTRPEVLEAAGAGEGSVARFSDSTGYSTLYLARRLDGPRGPLGFLRVAEPMDRAEAEVATLRNALLLGGGAMLLLALAASALIARGMSRPMREMEGAAARLSAGDLEGRVSVDGPEEVSRLAVSLNRMADQVRDRVAAERRTRADLEAVLAGMIEGVVAVDPRERILFMNSEAARMLGLTSPMAAGAGPWEAVRFPLLEESLRAVLRGAVPERADTRSPGNDGRILEISAVPLGAAAAPPGGAVPGAVAILRDVTEVRRLERIRMDFVANVSHELRTPLAGISGALETLEAGDLDGEERRRFLDIAGRNAGRLQSLVSDLLDLSAIESEGTALPLEPVPLDRPVRAAVASLSDLAARNRIALAVEPPAAETAVAGNPRRLEQAFLNLVENALKYTPPGGRVTVRILDRGPEAAVEVEDTGVGIPAEALPRIFERFYRVDPSRSRQMGGTGLGLAIVKHIVRAHRGRIEVRSVEGAGTTFTVLLPRARG